MSICYTLVDIETKEKVELYKGGFTLKEDAVLARDQYIIDNKLPHILNILKREQ